MHICCANCAIFPVKKLTSDGIGVKGLWFNPNVHPEEEYSKRYDALKSLEGIWGLDIEYAGSYGLDSFLGSLRKHYGIRCEMCYYMRLRETASTAKKMGLDGFTTTLLVSPHQRFDMIVDMGRRLEKEYGIPFYLEDFRPGWKEAVKASKELGLYRQKYCGCIYSKDEMEGAKR